MAKIRREANLIDWAGIEDLGDLERLRILLEAMPDEELIDKLESERNKKRDDYPVWMVWNTLLAGIIYGHPTIESLRRELLRNASLRKVCGISGIDGIKGVATKDVYYRFMKKLVNHRDDIDKIIERLVKELKKYLPDLGLKMAIDSTAINTNARGRWNPMESADKEADWGIKKVEEYRSKNGEITYREMKKWFGYKLHLVVDAVHEIPLWYRVTKASESDLKQAVDMVGEIKSRYAGTVKMKELIGDKGYDDGKLIRSLWEEHECKAVIDIRNIEMDEKSFCYGDGTSNIEIGQKGEVYCNEKKKGYENIRREMAYSGFEKSRGAHKYRCPASNYGVSCEYRQECCGNSKYGKVVRIKMADNYRKFPPIARNTYQWEREYDKRTSVERVNSRLKIGLGLDEIFLRGKNKIEVRAGLSIIVLLGMALGQLKHKKADKTAWRSLVNIAA